jgi:hypothetical protein
MYFKFNEQQVNASANNIKIGDQRRLVMDINVHYYRCCTVITLKTVDSKIFKTQIKNKSIQDTGTGHGLLIPNKRAVPPDSEFSDGWLANISPHLK